MFKTYTKQEMIDLFALKIERTELPSDYGWMFELENIGRCHTTKMPIRFIGEDRQDSVIAFHTAGLFDSIEPVRYAFLSEMLDQLAFREAI